MLCERTRQQEGGLQFDPRLRAVERQWTRCSHVQQQRCGERRPGTVHRETRVPCWQSVGAIGFGARGFAHEAGIADAGSILQSEVHPAIRVNRGAAFSADICEGFAHSLESILLLNGSRGCSLAMQLCGMVLGRHGGFRAREPVETGIAIVAAVHADAMRAEKIFLDGAAAMRAGYLNTSAIRAQPFGGRGE